MRYEHPNFGELKVFTVLPDQFSGKIVVREFSNGSPKSALSLSAKEAKQFEVKLAENGWNAVKSRSLGVDSRGGEEIQQAEKPRKAKAAGGKG